MTGVGEDKLIVKSHLLKDSGVHVWVLEAKPEEVE